MLQSSIICIKCKGRLLQIFEFNMISYNACRYETSNIRENACYVCKEEEQMSAIFTSEARKAMMKTKWSEVS